MERLTLFGETQAVVARVIRQENREVIRNDAFSNCKSLTDVRLPSGVKIIEKGTFAECTSLENLQLSNNTTEIEEIAFNNCISLKVYIYRTA